MNPIEIFDQEEMIWIILIDRDRENVGIMSSRYSVD